MSENGFKCGEIVLASCIILIYRLVKSLISHERLSFLIYQKVIACNALARYVIEKNDWIVSCWQSPCKLPSDGLMINYTHAFDLFFFVSDKEHS